MEEGKDYGSQELHLSQKYRFRNTGSVADIYKSWPLQMSADAA